MNKYFFFIIAICVSSQVYSQTIYVNAISGSDTAKGGIADPLLTLQKAVALAKLSVSDKSVTIKIAPGLYVLNTQLKIESKQGHNDTAKYTLEATVLPDDPLWTPPYMPVIQSISGNNTYKNFGRCEGIEIDRENVCIRGIKFVGNANPAADYYYPVEKDTLSLKNLEVSQCYFIGEKNGSPIQGAINVQGEGVHVDHCVFYGCKNAVMIFENMRNFSLTHSILYGAYEAAIWYGYKEPDYPFVFSDNIVSHCNYFWAGSKFDHSTYTFKNSLICENEHYVGVQNGRGGVLTSTANELFKEIGIRKTGKVLLTEVGVDGLPRFYLNLSPGSDGLDIQAGIFKTSFH